MASLPSQEDPFNSRLEDKKVLKDELLEKVSGGSADIDTNGGCFMGSCSKCEYCNVPVSMLLAWSVEIL